MMREKIKIAMIGMGSRGRFLTEGVLADSRYELSAVVDTDLANLASACPGLPPSVRRYSSLATALRENHFEAVAITTPDGTHADVAEPCFAAGKHILCEKPLDISLENCERILAAHRKAGTVLLIGFVLRYVRKLRKMHDLIAAGAIGRPIMAYANHEVPEGSRWYFHDWHAQRRYAAGLLLQKGSHDLDILNWFIGSRPVRVMASGGLDVMGGEEDDALECAHCARKDSCPDFTTHIDHFPELSKPIQCVHRRSVDVEDNHIVLVEYANGARASYTECHFSSHPRRSFCVIGSEGRIEASDEDEISLTRRHPADVERYRMAPVSGGHNGGDTLILDDFFQAIRNAEPPEADGDAGYFSVAVALAAHRAMREKRIVELIPKKELYGVELL